MQSDSTVAEYEVVRAKGAYNESVLRLVLDFEERLRVATCQWAYCYYRFLYYLVNPFRMLFSR